MRRWVWWLALAMATKSASSRAAGEYAEPLAPGWGELPAAEPEQGARTYGRGDCGCNCRSADKCGSAGGIDVRVVNTVGNCPWGTVLCCPVAVQPTPPSRPSPPPPSWNEACGQRSLLASPGPAQPGQARFGEFPWQAMLLNSEGRYVGSGALLSRRHVLTAAHVLPGGGAAALRVRLGEWDTGASAAGSAPLPPVDVRVRRVAVYPQYDGRSMAGDAALLELAADAPPPSAAPHVRSVCLPAGAAAAGSRCWVSGWGRDAFGPSGRWQRRQRAADLPLLAPGDCEARLRATRLGDGFRLDARSFLCAGGEQGKDACTGDGGAPLVCPAAGGGGSWEVVGLVSWGVGCGDAGVPGVYTNVAPMVPWVLQQMQTQLQQPPYGDPRGQNQRSTVTSNDSALFE